MFLIFAAVVLLLLIFLIRYNLGYWERKGVPGPKPWPIIGNIGSHLIGKMTMGEAIGEIYRKFEGYPFAGLFRATKPVLLIRDPDMLHRVLVKDFKSFAQNEFVINKETDPIFGRNPFILRGQEWKETRTMLTPGMTSGKMKNMYPILREISKNMVKYIENHPTATTDGIETRALTKRLTLDNVAKAAFGIDGKAFERYDDISEFNKLADEFLTPGTWTSYIFYLATVFPAILRCRFVKFVRPEVEQQLIEIVSDVVSYRRKNNIQANDYLQFLMELAKDRNLADIEITSHAATLFIDGYETSSAVLTFLLLSLAQNPEYQEKIRNDIRKYEKENDGELTYEAVHEMPWLNACLYESLRYRPAADFTVKECTEPFEYTPTNPDFKTITVKLNPGDVVLTPMAYFSKDARYFENPEKFMPERMMSKESMDKSIFFPFSDGPRGCIGQRLGRMMIKLATTYILKNFELSVSPKLQQPITYLPYNFMNEIRGGAWIRYKKISD
ncbi:unnamed protein product [Ceutorhynchus assimilis]|uniref:Cytochrome P450 n=1 Tax=Ceutorhynchus assimilis TaxID=467358 RepID=A0A9N9MLD0_9CUCU|nr:unnamed protein product [Ceutorhynchus assimilis]